MNIDKSYDIESDLNSDHASEYSIAEGEEASQDSLFQKRASPDLNSISAADPFLNDSDDELMESMNIERNNRSTHLESKLDKTNAQKNPKELPQFYQKLTKTLLKCSEDWFDCSKKNLEIEEFKELFLKTFRFSYFLTKKQEERTLFNRKIDKKLADLRDLGVVEPKLLVYNSEIDEVFIKSKDVYIDIEILDNRLHSEVMTELWTHISEVCESLSLKQEFFVTSSSSTRTRLLIIERSEAPYKIILRPTKHLGNSFDFYQTTLLSAYAKADSRFRIIAGFLTIWGMKRGVLNEKRLALKDLYHMLIYFFIHNKYMPSLQSKDWGLKENFIEISKKSHLNKQGKWLFSKRKVNFAFETDEARIRTYLNNNTTVFNSKLTVGEILPRFFYYFGEQLPKSFLEFQVRESPEDRQKYIVLDAQTGREKILDFHSGIEKISIEKYGDRKDIDKGYLIVDPFVNEVTTKTLIGRLGVEGVCKEIKEYMYNRPFDNPEEVFRNYRYEKLEVEFFVAYKRIMAGNGKEIFDAVDYKNLVIEK